MIRGCGWVITLVSLMGTARKMDMAQTTTTTTLDMDMAQTTTTTLDMDIRLT